MRGIFGRLGGAARSLAGRARRAVGRRGGRASGT